MPGRVVYYDIRTPGAVFYSDFPYTDLILKGSLCFPLPGRVVYYDLRTSGAVFYIDFPYTDLILKVNVRQVKFLKIVYCLKMMTTVV